MQGMWGSTASISSGVKVQFVRELILSLITSFSNTDSLGCRPAWPAVIVIIWQVQNFRVSVCNEYFCWLKKSLLWVKTSRPLCSAAASVQTATKLCAGFLLLLSNTIWLCWNLFQKSFLVWFGWRVVCVAQLICCLRSELWVNLCGRLKCKCRHEGNWDESQTLKREMRVWTCVYWGENTCREPPFLPLCGCVIVWMCLCVCVCVCVFVSELHAQQEIIALMPSRQQQPKWL